VTRYEVLAQPNVLAFAQLWTASGIAWEVRQMVIAGCSEHVDGKHHFLINWAKHIVGGAREYWSDRFNRYDFPAMLTTLLATALFDKDAYEQSVTVRLLASAGAFFLWMRQQRILLIFSRVGPYVFMVFAMMEDVLRYLVILLIFPVAFAAALVRLFQPPSSTTDNNLEWLPQDSQPLWDDCSAHFQSFPNALVFLIEQAITGDNFFACARHSTWPVMTWIIAFLYVTFAGLLLLNMLIAMMAQSFDQGSNAKSMNYIFLRSQMNFTAAKQPLAPPPFFLLTIPCEFIVRPALAFLNEFVCTIFHAEASPRLECIPPFIGWEQQEAPENPGDECSGVEIASWRLGAALRERLEQEVKAEERQVPEQQQQQPSDGTPSGPLAAKGRLPVIHFSETEFNAFKIGGLRRDSYIKVELPEAMSSMGAKQIAYFRPDFCCGLSPPPVVWKEVGAPTGGGTAVDSKKFSVALRKKVEVATQRKATQRKVQFSVTELQSLGVGPGQIKWNSYVELVGLKNADEVVYFQVEIGDMELEHASVDKQNCDVKRLRTYIEEFDDEDAQKDRRHDFVRRDTSNAIQAVEQVKRQLANVEDKLREIKPDGTEAQNLAKYERRLQHVPDVSEQILGLKKWMDSSFSSIQEQLKEMDERHHERRAGSGTMPPERPPSIGDGQGHHRMPSTSSHLHRTSSYSPHEYAHGLQRVGRGGSLISS